MTTALCFLAVLLVGGYLWHRDRLTLIADHDEHDAEWAGECLRLWWERESVIKAFSAKYAEQTRAVIEAEEQVYRAADDLEWEQVQHAVTQAERDMYCTALRGELTRQVNAELLHPDEPVGTATVIDWPVAEVVPLRKGGRR